MSTTVECTVVRTAMVGGGTAYDVYVRRDQKQYRPIAAGCYATTIVRDGVRYYRLSDFLRTPELDALPALTDERLTAFRRIERLSERLSAIIAARAFPELSGMRKLPMFWTSENHQSAQRTVPITLHDRYVA